ncbi:MAG: hypothetical protein WBH22_27235 [Pseudomonas mandelii]|uniref:hypothetical protein n=1 Tax=Pseudomonas mandelii TaxID=75612 RepID=UPI003C74E508
MVDDESWCVPGETYSENQPEIKPPPEPDIESLRLIAYADPVYGCDRYLAEAASLLASGADPASADVIALQAKALEVKASIRTRFPYPAEA